MKLTKTTGWGLGTAGLCVAVAAGSWFGLVDPARAEASQARQDTAAAQSSNAQLEVRIAQLKEEFADLPARQAELAAVREALPEEVALATLLRQLDEQATDAGVVLNSVTADTPVAVVDPAASPVAPPEDAAGAAPSGEASAAPSAEPSAAPTDGTADGTGAGDPAADPGADPAATGVDASTQPVLAAVPVVVTTTGDYTETALALKNIQAQMPRAFLVDSLGLSVASEGSTAEGDATSSDEGLITATITGRVFAFVDPTAVDIEGIEGIAPVDPTAAPSAEPSDG